MYVSTNTDILWNSFDWVIPLQECPTLWRIYQYVNDEERVMIMRSRVEKNHLAIGEGGEGYIGEEMWCYNCANTGHLGDVSGYSYCRLSF